MLERRNHLRHHVSTVAYVDLNGGAGGILLDISEGGMSIQAVGRTFAKKETIRFRLELVGTPHHIEGEGTVAWSANSGQAGIQFLQLAPKLRQTLKDWLFTNALSGWSSPAPVPDPDLPIPQIRAPQLAQAAVPRTESLPAHAGVSVEPAWVAKTMRREVRRAAPSALKPGVLFGPFPLTIRSVDSNVSSDASGVFLLGDLENRTFEVKKIGRSDDLKSTLAEYLGRYRQFKYAFSLSDLDAWNHECQLYHQYRPCDNKSHPTRRYGADWDCPVCHGFA